MRVLVTGGAGFIGAHLVRLLAADPGTEVVVLDNLSTGVSANLDDVRSEFLEGDVRDRATVERAATGADAIVHLAAVPSVPRSVRDPWNSHDVNATGTLQVLEIARRMAIGQVILASSSSVYGDNPTLPKHEDLAPRARSPYAASKLAAESYALAYAAVYDLPVLAFRFFNVFGPLQRAGHAYAAVIPAFVEAAVEGRCIEVHGDGLQTRDFTYVGSVTAVVAAALQRRVRHDNPVNLAFGSRRSLLEVVATLESFLGRRLAVEHTPARPGDVRHSQADQTRLRGLFPDIEPVPFARGLHATVDWFRTSAVRAPLVGLAPTST